MSNKEKLLKDEKSSSRSKRKLQLIVCLLALFIPIIVAVICASIILKQQTESNSLSFFPTNAITSVCDLISGDPDSCFDSIATLHSAQIPSRHEINPSQIFILSLYASRIELENVVTSIEKSISEVAMIKLESVGVLRNCQGMIEFSLKKLNESEMSLGIDPAEKTLAINKVVWDLQLWIGEAMGNVQGCYDLLEKIPSTTVRAEIRRKSYEALQKMKNSRGILQNMDEILDLFYPRIGTALVSLAWEYDYGRTVWLFCFEYLLLIFLFCLLLRIY
ncbi:pectinesterase 1-like [Solanum lycopersicum]|uniref:Pectinesterase inhibitor domain-containing protein n=1 Tax=Solanum lycopersicum TaxID=4081 RepID=A0A3Q7FPN6_SOLLC|nr:pectinesterase 1 [Solanum lycopersicum]